MRGAEADIAEVLGPDPRVAHPLTGPSVALAPGCSARPRPALSNSASRSGANLDTSARQRRTCSTATASRRCAAPAGQVREDLGRGARGRRLVDALIVWITPARQLQPGINRFEVRVSEAGDAWIERLRW